MAKKRKRKSRKIPHFGFVPNTPKRKEKPADIRYGLGLAHTELNPE